MATEVKLPDVLEGVQDVTINRWLVKAGETVKKGQPILEVATEKVDTQVESPADGTILALNFGEGELVKISAVLALIGSPDEQAPQAAPARAPEEPENSQVAEAPMGPTEPTGPADEAKSAGGEATGGEPGKEPLPPDGAAKGAVTASQDGQGEAKATPVARRVAEEQGVSLEQVTGTGPGGQVTKEDVLAYAAQKKQGDGQSAAAGAVTEQKAGGEAPRSPEAGGEVTREAIPLPVQRLAVEYNVDLRQIAGDRPLGAVTEAEVLQAARQQGRPAPEPRQFRPEWQQAEAQPAAAQPAAGQRAAPQQAPAGPAPQSARAAAAGAQPQAAPAGGQAGEELVPHTRMRTLIAKNTTQSAQTAPQVTTWWDVDMTAVIEHRRAHKAEYQAEGANLTVTAYLVAATIAGLRKVPAANSSWSDEGVLIKHYYNIGIAVAIPMDEHGLGGLIVPVIKNAGDLSLMGLARAVNDLAQRARKNQLTAADLQGGTFSVSNYGTSGSRFQTPIITGNQAGILGVGAIEKRPVLHSEGSPLEPSLRDYLAFVPMLTLGFTFDHRILDGATADAFCAGVKDALENWK